MVATALTRLWPGTPEPLHIALAIVIAVLACATIGAVNGLVIGRLRVQPFIVTLASMIGVRGFAKWCTSNENVDIGFGDDVASRFASIFREKVVVIGTYVAAAALFWLLLSKTVFGRRVRANRSGADFCRGVLCRGAVGAQTTFTERASHAC
jgi:ribose/xylose/arabinose/galactoside ABC-type transport system permease subunit